MLIYSVVLLPTLSRREVIRAKCLLKTEMARKASDTENIQQRVVMMKMNVQIWKGQ